MTILNPESIGDPDQTPIVQLTPEQVRAFNPCREDVGRTHWCGGINGFHKEGCTKAQPGKTFPDRDTEGASQWPR